MPSLQTVLTELEEDLTRVIRTAWDTSLFGPIKSLYTDVPEEPATVSSLPAVALLMPSVEAAGDEYASICSEASSVQVDIYLHAMKPRGVTLANEKRQRAQELRSALKDAVEADDIRHASLILWASDTYQEQEDFQVAALSDAYVIRVRYQMIVEWSD